jgi:hypothetical protein
MHFTINLVTPDNGERFLIELENATLTNIAGFQAENPALTLTINRSDLERTMMGAKTLEAQIADGTAKVQGDVSVLQSSPQSWWISIRASRSCRAPRCGRTWWRMPIPTKRCRARRSPNSKARVHRMNEIRPDFRRLTAPRWIDLIQGAPVANPFSQGQRPESTLTSRVVSTQLRHSVAVADRSSQS